MLPRQVCPLCVTDDEVSGLPLVEGAYAYECRRRVHGDGPVRWTSVGDERVADAYDAEGPAHELGMLEDLAACVYPDDGWTEYGVIEDRYARLNRQAFDELRERYGHRLLGPTRNPRYTATVYIATVLRMLRDRDALVQRWGKATGVWSYNSGISYWALPPAPSTDRTLTYAAFVDIAEKNPEEAAP